MVLMKNDGHIGFIKDKKNGMAIIILLLVYDASKISTVHVVKWQVLGLQRAPENSEFPPSLRTLCLNK